MKKQRHHFVDKVSIVRAMVFPVVIYRHIQSYTVIYGHIRSYTDRVEPQRRLSAKELMLLNCGAGEDS